MLLLGDCIENLLELKDNSIDACVTDPPYGLTSIIKRFGCKNSKNTPAMNTKEGGVFARKAAGFMGKVWDGSGIEYSPELWREVLRVLKPGGHLLSFGGSRTYHRMACAIEDAGFEIRDQIMWVYGSGFPKSLNIGKAVDNLQGNKRKVVGYAESTPDLRDVDRISKENCGIDKLSFGQGQGAKRQQIPIDKGTSPWEGYGTALKPAHEPIVLARKPLSEKTVALNCLKWGVGGLAIDNCSVGTETIKSLGGRKSNMVGDNRDEKGAGMFAAGKPNLNTEHQGRFPANLIHDGSDEVVDLFPNTKSGAMKKPYKYTNNGFSLGKPTGETKQIHGASEGSVARFFYCAKASKSERDRGYDIVKEKNSIPSGEAFGDGSAITGHSDRKGNNHPTVKPLALMKYLVTLISREGQTVLDPFMGSGTTGMACKELNRKFIGIEKEQEYFNIAEKRINITPERLF